ncbi:hypothetical protein ACIPUB_14230 [Paeniglutamicibacter sp. ORCA_105]|uniref:hypothetical protein n=1 Tax=Paeniglutamicibacter sp. ORCA_105 TaxID=3377336 RepID=UPI0038952E56
MSRDAVEQRLAKHHATAALTCKTLQTKKITLRHTTAMALLHAGVDCTVRALWLGRAYMYGNMTIKERAFALTTSIASRPGRCQAPDSLMDSLKGMQLCRYDIYRSEQEARHRHVTGLLRA